MPKYRFEYSGSSEPPVTVELDGPEAAKHQAIATVKETVEDDIAAGRDPGSVAVRVYDESGGLIQDVKFSDLFRRR